MMKNTAIYIISLLFCLTAYGEDRTHGKAIFAGGCFWCMQPPFDKLPGVTSTIVGYTGGELSNPSYEQVSAGGTGHAEAIEVNYDPEQVNYEQLLDVFWRNVDPTDAAGQFCDKGYQYRSAIFYLDDNQKQLAEQSKQQLIDSGKFNIIATEITMATEFYPAEDYHQNYYKNNPIRYKFYRRGCGRDKRLNTIWGKS